ncbi:hypothetical protein KP509_22G004400 [Ceratopteris richardii]|uniref:Pentatricopeptide repeat-containing protein n=1 Tax=Ceratopteris richardii TaxID=49495 RepID=A0A8T2S497_CERRI|nr:hypothetical protein KP509_22G004400 [Ceratopteris richardii]
MTAISSNLDNLFLKPGIVTSITAALRHSSKTRSLSDGRLLHAYIYSCGLDTYTYVGNCLIEMYADCSSLRDALHVFSCLSNPNIYSWNILVKAYCKNGSLSEGFHVFSSMPVKDSVSWNTVISALAQNGYSDQALGLFQQMLEEKFLPNNFSFTSALDACIGCADVEQVRGIHGSLVNFGYDHDILVNTALLSAYGKCRMLHDAVSVFISSSNRDIVCWNAIISVFSQMKKTREALYSFQWMLQNDFMPNAISFICVLESCGFEEGQIVHYYVLESSHDQDIEVCTALLGMYGSSGSLRDAMRVFQKMTQRTTVSWNAMIAMLIHNNHGMDALNMYRSMRMEGFEPDKATYTSIINACACQALLSEGHNVHTDVIYGQHEQDTCLCNALVSLYGECGYLHDACRIFERIPQKDGISWTAIINASVQNSHHERALNLFHAMQVEGFKPDNIVFVSILTSCARSGLVEEGKRVFISLSWDHEVCISGEHYVCLVYLLGWAGQLDAAEEVIHYMPTENRGTAWLSLLSSCKLHEDIECARKAAAICRQLIPENVAPYVLLSNMVAADELFTDLE